MAGRDTPRDIQYAMPSKPMLDSKGATLLPPEKAMSLGRECYQSSTNWLNAGRRLKWSDSLRAFQGLHPSESKYLSTDYRYRSRLFVPKTRSVIRNAEAQTAAAFFANEDVVNISAQDDDNPMQQASAEINQKLLQYRLTKTIPWFLTLMGARQDAEVMGVCIGKVFWKYAEQFSHTEPRPAIDPLTGMSAFDPVTGAPVIDEYDVFSRAYDHPWIDLIAPENFRFDPGADWRNPVATSPYTIELIPMYVCDVMEKIDSGEWLPVSQSAVLGATNLDDDTTRRSREQGRVPGKDNDAQKPRDFEICWVREHVMRWGGTEWHYYALGGSGQLLTNPVPLKEVYLQGVRPYVAGMLIPEAHKVYPSGTPELMRDLQTQLNDVTNLRLDNVKLALNPRQVVRAGSQIDPQDARTFMPGKVLITTNPQGDIIWDRPPDATAGSYQETDRTTVLLDELTGNVSAASISQNQQTYQAVGNMQMLQGNAATIGEYELRVFAETFVEPIIRQLVKLEQMYESDPVILAIAGREAQLYQKYGMNEVTDYLLQQELTVRVNVGIGATNPKQRLGNFLTAAQAVGTIFGPAAAMGASFSEVTKEVFSLCGYKDGARFFTPGFDPQKAMAENQPQAPVLNPPDPYKLEAEKIRQEGDYQEALLKSQTDIYTTQLKIAADADKAAMQQHHDTQRAVAASYAASKPTTMVQFDAKGELDGVGAAMMQAANTMQTIAAHSAQQTELNNNILQQLLGTMNSVVEATHHVAASTREMAAATLLPKELYIDPKTKTKIARPIMPTQTGA